MSWLRAHGLVLVNVLLFAIFLVGMTVAGWQVANDELVQHGMAALGLGAYLASGDFWEAVSENWESEFLQMGSYVVLTVFLFQKGSSESKPLTGKAPQDADPRKHSRDPRAPWPVRHGGIALVLYENSLLLLFAVLFIASFVTHVVSGAAAYSEEQQLHGLPEVTPLEYLGTSQLWFESFQNWQSEFMVVALLAGAAVYLRQRGSPESKPVHAPHDETGTED
jgi:TRAP-type C4-dicarboxylate transport system permease small subunit